MSVTANLQVAADDFVLGELLGLDSKIQVRLEPLIQTGEAVVPYLRVVGSDAETVEAVGTEDPSIEQIRHVDGDGESVLFRVEWTSELDDFARALVTTRGTVLEAEGSGDRWSFRLRFPSGDSLSQFYRACTRYGLEISLLNVRQSTRREGSEPYNLTPEQQETIVRAFEGGYFGVPRKTTLANLSERMNVSDSAVSQRLRRGLSTLIEATVLDADAQRRDSGTRNS